MLLVRFTHWHIHCRSVLLCFNVISVGLTGPYLICICRPRAGTSTHRQRTLQLITNFSGRGSHQRSVAHLKPLLQFCFKSLILYLFSSGPRRAPLWGARPRCCGPPLGPPCHRGAGVGARALAARGSLQPGSRRGWWENRAGLSGETPAQLSGKPRPLSSCICGVDFELFLRLSLGMCFSEILLCFKAWALSPVL